MLVLAAFASVLVAYWCDRFLVATFHATSATFALDVSPDSRALAFTCGAAAVAFLVFALGPALSAADVDGSALSAASTRTTGDRHAARRAILIAQVALTLVLVAVGSVFVEALESLRRAPLGFDVERVLDVPVAPLPGGYPDGFGPAPYYRSLLERLQAIPGIESVALAHFDPFFTAPLVEGTGVAGRNTPIVSVEEAIVTDGFFQTMRIPLVAGEDFRRSDEARRGRTVSVSESLARRLFGVDPAIGRLIRVGTNPNLQAIRVIGVARDAVLSRPETRNTIVAYHNFWQAPAFSPTLVMHTRIDPAIVATSVRDVLRREGREYPVRIHTLIEARDASLSQERLLVLAAVGVYGLLAFTVASRTIEIGVRMALGASRTSVLRLVVGDACRTIGLGVLVGAPLAWVAARAASRLLAGAAPPTVAPIVVAVLLLASVGAVAAAIPARRASSIDPMQALRHD